MTGSRWRSWHLHVAGDAALLAGAGAEADRVLLDRVVREVVAPVMAGLDGRVAGGLRWFFVRHDEGGPHIRLRVRALPRNLVAPVERALHRGMARLGAESTMVRRVPYRPETGRFGTAGLLSLSEALFWRSSRACVDFLTAGAAVPDMCRRRGFALSATEAALGAVDAGNRARFCRRARVSWLLWAGRTGAPWLDLPWLLRIDAPPPLDRAGWPALRRWGGALAAAMPRWGEATGTGRLPLTPVQLLATHIHLLHNRLGLGIGDEIVHYGAIARRLAGQPEADAGTLPWPEPPEPAAGPVPPAPVRQLLRRLADAGTEVIWAPAGPARRATGQWVRAGRARPAQVFPAGLAAAFPGRDPDSWLVLVGQRPAGRTAPARELAALAVGLDGVDAYPQAVAVLHHGARR